MHLKHKAIHFKLQASCAVMHLASQNYLSPPFVVLTTLGCLGMFIAPNFSHIKDKCLVEVINL